MKKEAVKTVTTLIKLENKSLSTEKRKQKILLWVYIFVVYLRRQIDNKLGKTFQGTETKQSKDKIR